VQEKTSAEDFEGLRGLKELRLEGALDVDELEELPLKLPLYAVTVEVDDPSAWRRLLRWLRGPNSRRLKKLGINSILEEHQILQLFGRPLKNLPQLRELVLENIQGSAKCLELLGQLTALTVLESEVTMYLPELPSSLQRVSLGPEVHVCWYPQGDFEEPSVCLPHLTSLTLLSEPDNELAQLHELEMEALGGFENLRELELSTRQQSARLLLHLGNLVELTSLAVSCVVCDEDDEGVDALCELQGLQQLVLRGQGEGGWNIGPYAAMVLRSSLTQVEQLDLRVANDPQELKQCTRVSTWSEVRGAAPGLLG
jgi:hypothetical protein